MSLTGVVVPGSPLSPGGTLISDVSATDTVLEIDDAADFAESFDEAHFLVIGNESTPREYVAVQNDEEAPPETVTLAVAVGGSGFEAGLPVTPWDPDAEGDDKRAVTYRVWVRLDGFAVDAAPVPAYVEQNRVPTASDYNLEGARVELTKDDGGDFWVNRVLGRDAIIDKTLITNSEFRTNTGGNDIEILPGDAGEAATIKFASASPYYKPGQPAQLQCFDSRTITSETLDLVNLILQGAAQEGTDRNPSITVSSIHRESDGAVRGQIAYSVDSTEPTGFDGRHLFLVDAGTALSISPAGVTTLVGFYDSFAAGGGTTTASIDNSGKIIRTPSSQRYKADIEELTADTARVILNLRPVTFRWNENLNMGSRRQPGFIAEEAHDAGAGLWVTYANDDPTDTPEGFRYPELTAALLAVVKDQESRIARLEQQVAALLDSAGP